MASAKDGYPKVLALFAREIVELDPRGSRTANAPGVRWCQAG
jgi:hypothetical protein